MTLLHFKLASPLKVLMVCHWFPPSNVIGAVRLGKLAKSLHDAGHDLRVLAADVPGDHTLPLEIPANRVTYVHAKQRDQVFDSLTSLIPLSYTKTVTGLKATPD